MRFTKQNVQWTEALVCAVLAATVCGGCAARAKNITGAPVGVSVTAVQNWDAAVANLQKVAAASSAARQAVEGLNKSGVFPDGPAYVRTLTDLGKIDQAQIAAANFLQTVPNDWGQSTQMQVQAYTQTIGALVNDLTANGTIGIKDAASQSAVKTSIDAITAAVKLILDLFAPVAVPAS